MSERACGKPATQRVFWPGREPILMCEEHADGARKVGAAIGCYIAQQPVNEGTCSSKTSKAAHE